MTRPYKIIKFKDDWIITPTTDIYCPFCGNDMLFHDYLVEKSAYGWYHADIHLKCSVCGFYATFGIPIGKEDYNKLANSKYHRKIIDVEITDLYPELKNKLKSRLEKWGYW